MKQKSFAMLLLVFSPLAYAHPGEHHGNMLDAIVHLVSEPDHLIMAGVAVLVGITGARVYRRLRQTRMQDKHR